MEKLTWQEIEKNYDQQWVQLVDYEWPEGTPYPKSGVVRVHASTRKEFNQRVSEKERPTDAARVFVGKPSIPPNTIISCSSMKLTKCN